MNTLEKTCKSNRRIIGVIIMVVGIVLLLWKGNGIFKFLDVQTITADSDLSKLKGKIVSYEFDCYLDVYEDITDSKKTPKYTGYMMYARSETENKGFAFGLWRSVSYDNEMDKLINDYNNAIDKMDNSLKPKPITVKGLLVQMDSEDKGFFTKTEQYYKDYGYTFDSQYYYIFENVTDEKGNNDFTKVFMFAGASAIAFVVGLFIFITAGMGWDKKLKNFALMNSTTMEQMTLDVEGGTYFANGSMIVGAKTFYYATGGKAQAIRLDNVCWGYHEYKRTGRNTISELVLCDTAGKRTRIACAEPIARDILNNMVKKCPWLIAGFKAEWDKMYRSSLDEFLRLHYYEGKQQAGGTAAATSYVDPFEEYNRQQEEMQQASMRRETPLAQQPAEEKKSTGFEDFVSWSQKNKNDDNNNI